MFYITVHYLKYLVYWKAKLMILKNLLKYCYLNSMKIVLFGDGCTGKSTMYEKYDHKECYLTDDKCYILVSSLYDQNDQNYYTLD